ncbi:hypothetical protein PTTG_06430 [Puccinia triticina 1-1 BBBD Race 1]|uniref:DDE Tnp4 domain-containing protein n=1 Tax=Puccinia triticina (isolate 1-1 / race 1 (BBBD)) TaxID=630390 RepID=A0A0C4F014_PUCT1|nr:hypothetical protein PTTG_06430 [Puccinia triticina 1-1 BBBD Race 1]
MAAYTLQQIFSLTPSVCSCYLSCGIQILLEVLKSLRNARITWPSTLDTIQPFAEAIKKKFPLLKGCFGFVDGLNLPVLVSDNDDVQNAYYYYNGWTCSHYCSCILAFAPDGTIMYAIPNAPGSWHDSAITGPLYDELLRNTPTGFQILSDTAFPRKSERLQSRILAPAKRGDCLPSTPRSYTRLKLLNKQVVSARQAAEWGMNSLQGSFARLKLPLPASDHWFRADVLQVVCRLHQLCCWMVKLNQTQTVYNSVWDKLHVVSREFHKMLFKILKNNVTLAVTTVTGYDFQYLYFFKLFFVCSCLFDASEDLTRKKNCA